MRKFSQRDLLEEGIWNTLKKTARSGVRGIAKTLDYVVPELTNPIHSLEDAGRDILGMKPASGTSRTGGYDSHKRNGVSYNKSGKPTPKRSAPSKQNVAGQGIVSHQGKNYQIDLSQQPTPKGGKYEVKAYLVDNNGQRQSNRPYTLLVDDQFKVSRVY